MSKQTKFESSTYFVGHCPACCQHCLETDNHICGLVEKTYTQTELDQAVREGIEEYKDNLPEHHKRAMALADIEYSRQHSKYRRRTNHMPERGKHA